MYFRYITIIFYILGLNLSAQTDKSLVKLGLECYENEDYSEALKHFSSVLKSDPGNTDVYFYRGHTYFAKGNYQKAINDFSKSLDIKQDNIDVIFNRASAYYELEDYLMALSDYNKVLELDNNYAEAYRGKKSFCPGCHKAKRCCCSCRQL